eukprot:COSAG05_NODE_12573_length_462_cov_7.460055_1_plen_69_part_10
MKRVTLVRTSVTKRSVLHRLLDRTFHHLGSHNVCEGGCFPSSLCFLNELVTAHVYACHLAIMHVTCHLA